VIVQVEQLLKQLIGLEAESVGRSVIERAMRQRMASLALQDTREYWLQLSRSSIEQQALVEAVVVPETWFFRYPESFSALSDLALKRQAELGASRPLRLLSLPCSSGEEPYSIVMTLLDAGFAPGTFQVEAVDVSARVLELARVGHYGRNSFRGKALEFRDRYFTATESGFQLQAQVLDRVRLRCGNLLDNALLGGEAPFDFVFCRNLLIYFDRPTQTAVLDVLQRVLHEQGTFFVGPAEASLLTQRGMQALGVPLTFAFQRAAPAAERPPLRRLVQLPVRSAPLPKAAPRPTPVVPKAPVAAPRPSAAVDPAAKALATIATLADAGRSDEARQACERYLHEYGPHADAYYWAGLLSDLAGQGDSAQDFYRKALYLDPEHVESLVHLAALLAARGDQQGALRLQQRAKRTSHSGVKRDGR
jgi:chemotaxis protein methyltransferase WspC